HGYARPSGDSAPSLSPTTNPSPMTIRLTPPARASVDSPLRRLSAAMCTATSDDDWAESTTRLGPCRPSAYETRLAMRPRLSPVMLVCVTASGPWEYASLA